MSASTVFGSLTAFVPLVCLPALGSSLHVCLTVSSMGGALRHVVGPSLCRATRRVKPHGLPPHDARPCGSKRLRCIHLVHPYGAGACRLQC